MTKRGFWIRQSIALHDIGSHVLASRCYYFGTRHDTGKDSREAYAETMWH